MEYQERKCPKCGASLENRNGEYYCEHCKKAWQDTTLIRAIETLEESLKKTIRGEVSAALLEQRMADCYKYLTELWCALSPLNENKPVTQTSLVLRYAQKIMDLSQENSFLHNRAKFYCLASKNKWTELNDFLAALRFNADEKWVVEEIIKYLENTNNAKWALGAQALITNTYAENESERDCYRQRLTEAESLVNDGTFDPALNRDVFIAYSSKDIDKAMELLKKLEERDIDCFFALRNLSNVGAEYDKDLTTALEHCKVFVFVSTQNSRTRNCDAYNIELKRVWEMDEKRNKKSTNYEHLPIRYKKPRVEWLLDEYNGTRYDKEVAMFFKGFTRHADINQVVVSIEEFLNNDTYEIEQETSQPPIPQPERETSTEITQEQPVRKETEEKEYKESTESARVVRPFHRQMPSPISEIGSSKAAEEKARKEAEEKARLREQQIARERAEEQARKETEEWYNTGERYYKAQNYAEAVKWYQKAAEQGNVDAQYKLGYSYYFGKGIERNNAEAAKWFEKAVQNGYKDAGGFYEDALKKAQTEAKERARIQEQERARERAEEWYQVGEDCYNEKNYAEAVKWYQKAAEQGNADAQYRLGERYYKAQNYAEAVKWYQKAAEQGNADAQYELGYSYYHGRGVERNYEEAFKWFEKAAKRDNADAQYKLGECYYYGNGVERNYEEAVKWFEKAAERDNADAQYKLGECYYNGVGVVQNYKEALKRFEKAAEQNNADAQYKLGECYYNGRGVEKSYEEAFKWFKKAAEQGNADAQYNLGVCYYHGRGVKKNYEEAAKWFEKAGDTKMLKKAKRKQLGFFGLLKGIIDRKRVKRQTITEEEYYIEEAEFIEEERPEEVDSLKDKEDTKEWYNTGVRYYNEKNYAEAVKWHRKAAEQGHADAQNYLGFCYHQGRGVELNHEEAVKWYQKAAEQGNAEAQSSLGFCYERGHGVEQNYAEAAKWYKKAADNGYSKASTYYQDILNKI